MGHFFLFHILIYSDSGSTLTLLELTGEKDVYEHIVQKFTLISAITPRVPTGCVKFSEIDLL